MPLPSPNLDDRTFEQLVAECKARITASCPEWTDLSVHDPGITLVELFAHLTEVMLYRFNRIPEKVYVELLRVIGLQLTPPFAASTELVFTRSGDAKEGFEIPRGTRVSLGRAAPGTEAPVFVTANAITLKAGESSGTALACHCEWIRGESLGRATGLPGASLKVSHAPLVGPLHNPLDLVLAVEAPREELKDRARAVTVDGKSYRIWREVEHFVDLGDDPYAYVVDRASGVITFSSGVRGRRPGDAGLGPLQTLAAIPASGREILVWYSRGGGASGNVAGGTLTVLKDPLPGMTVINPSAAKGGLDTETVSNALVRGPLELHSLDRAVTAQDFERLATRQAGLISRAKAFTHAALWKHGLPGTVEVLLVPSFPQPLRGNGPITEAQLKAQQTETARQTVAAEFEERRPLGTTCLVNWARYKPVKVRARVVIRRQEDRDAVSRRVLRKLYDAVSPLPGVPGALKGRSFGQTLRASQVYDEILTEPGVAYVEQVRLIVESTPENAITAMALDMFQTDTWYVAAGPALFRSMNRTSSWEPLATFEGESVRLIRAHPSRPGWVVLVTNGTKDQPGCRVYVNVDCGESGWTLAAPVAFTIDDVIWLFHRDKPTVLLAADTGLFELAVDKAPGTPVQVVVDPKNQQLGFYAMTIAQRRSGVFVAAAARAGQGVFLSTEGGRTESFKPFGLKNENIRVLEAQQIGPRHFLWAGAAVPGFEAGKGCFRRELEVGDSDWTAYNRGWTSGSCLGVAFSKEYVFANTANDGVLRLRWAAAEAAAQWEGPGAQCGLPSQELGKFVRTTAITTETLTDFCLVGTAAGLFKTEDGLAFVSASQKEFVDQVTLPPTWLFCSAEHDVTVINEDEARGD